MGKSQSPLWRFETRLRTEMLRTFVNDLSDYDPGAERIADEQALKMRKFVSEWFNTAPDVRDGHIRNNRWPDAI